jgi:subtilisin-like proprotein convertase family protein
VVLTNFAHTYPDDVDILLVAPDGWSALLLSDAGGGNAVAGVTLQLDDAATAFVPDRFTITNGLYRPTNFDTTDTLPSPAPTGGYGTNLASFNGGMPNGVWSLYVYDDFFSDTGSLGGWSLTLTTVGIVNPTPPILSQVMVTTNSQLRFLLSGTVGDTYSIEVSANLAAWSSIGTLTLTSTSQLFTDPQAIIGMTNRFYRAWRVP